MTVTTVRGDVGSDQLGIVLPHEHLQLDGYVRSGNVSSLLNSEEIAIEELAHYASLGGRTVVDVTTPDQGRRPAALLRISEAADVHVVMGSGHYRDVSYPAEVYECSTDEIAKRIISDLEDGVDGVRAGIIGEIGNDLDYLKPSEERSFRAAARAQKATGAPLTTHAFGYPIGLAQINLLEEERVDLSRVIVGHVDSYPDERYYRALLARGVMIEFDLLIWDLISSDAHRIPNLVALINDGYADQLLLSHDICMRKNLRSFGGPGYGYLLEEFVPKLLAAGVSREQIDEILISNPARVLDV